MSQTTVKTSMRAIDEAAAVLTRHRMSKPVEHEGQVSSVCTCGVMKTGRNYEDIEDQAARHLAAMLAEAGLL